MSAAISSPPSYDEAMGLNRKSMHNAQEPTCTLCKGSGNLINSPYGSSDIRSKYDTMVDCVCTNQLHEWKDIEPKLKAGAYGKWYPINVIVARETLWQVFGTRNDLVHMIYSHNIRIKLVGDGKDQDAELKKFIVKRWMEHSKHPLVTGIISAAAAASVSASAPVVKPPLGLDPSDLFTLH